MNSIMDDLPSLKGIGKTIKYETAHECFQCEHIFKATKCPKCGCQSYKILWEKRTEKYDGQMQLSLSA